MQYVGVVPNHVTMVNVLSTCADLGTVSSPGLNLAVQSLLIGKSSLIGGEAWLPALVEALMITGSNSTGSSSVQQIIAPVLISGFPNTTTSLNMVEVSAQALITSFHYIQNYLLRYSGLMNWLCSNSSHNAENQGDREIFSRSDEENVEDLLGVAERPLQDKGWIPPPDSAYSNSSESVIISDEVSLLEDAEAQTRMFPCSDNLKDASEQVGTATGNHQ